jgi:cytochrome P450
LWSRPQSQGARAVVKDAEIGGLSVPGEPDGALSFAAANRDPVMFEHADRAVIGRKTNRHLAFGIGSHRRIGSTWRDRGRARGMAGGHSLLFR